MLWAEKTTGLPVEYFVREREMMVNIEDFSKLELKVGKIIDVSDHPKADKLYILKVDIGEKQIQLVAGIKNFYSKEELKNKLIVVLVNLEPKALRGVVSEGMLLAAQYKDIISILTPDKNVAPGSIIR